MKKMAKTKVEAVQCSKCGDIIFSRARHDYRPCGCGKIFIDGGFDYVRIGFAGSTLPERIELVINATKDELYDDWNKGQNKFGLIKLGKTSKKKAVKRGEK